MEKEMEADTKIYLSFIRGMGIKAWIPGSPGSGPKMSTIGQCRSGVLCLDYKGSDIYIQGNSRRAKNDKSSTGLVKNLYHVKSVQLENDESNRFDGGLGNTAVNDNLGVNITSHDDKVKFKRDVVDIQRSDKNIIDNSLEIPNVSKSIANHLKKSAEARVNVIVQKTFIPEITGVVYKRIVEEKLTREVKVAKCYVSSLPNSALNYGSCDTTVSKNCHLDKKALRSDYTGKLWKSLDCRRLDEIKKSGLSPGFVRKLIEQFDVYDNVEQQRPSRKTL